MSLDRRSCAAASPAGDLARLALGDAFLSRRATGGLLQDGAAPQRRAVRFSAPPLS
jgi:hypothetical protein